MAFDINRLRTDQLQRLLEVDLDVNQLETSELEDLLASQEEYSDLGAGFASLGSALQTGLAGILGSEDLAEQARRTQEEIALRRTPDVPSIIESFEEEGILGGLADVPEYIQEQLFFSLPQLAGQLGAGVIGTRLGGPRAGAAAAVGAGTPAFAGYNIQRQMEEQDIGIEDAQVAKAFAVGTGQAALDAVIGRTLGVFGRTEGAEQIANAAQRGLASRVARKGMEGARVEALTEAGQQALEIVQANPEKFFEFGPEVQRELAESAIAGGLIGGTISAPVGIMKPRDQAVDKQADLERHLQEEAEETRRMEEEAARFEGETLRLEAPRPGLPAPGQAAIGVPPGGFREPGVVDEVREEGVGRVEPGAEPGLPAVRDVIDVPPGGFRDERERVRETVREEGVGRAPVFEEPQAPEILEGEVVGGLPAVQEAEPAPELDIPVSTVPRPALPRGTGAIQVPPTARQRGTVEGRLAGMEEVVSGVTEPTTARAEEALRERRKMELVDPFNDDRSRQLLDKLNREEQAGNTTKAKNTRQKLQERLRELGLDAEQTSRLLSGTPAEREQLRLFSQKVARQEAEQTRETAKQAYDSNTISNFNQRAERIRKDLGSELRKLGLSDVALRMDKVIRPEPETLAEGVTEQDKFGNILIALSSQIYSPGMSDAELKAKLREVMNHEMIHAMKMLGLFTDAEYQSLVKAATNQKFVDKQGNQRTFSYLDRAQRLYANDTPEIQQEEAIAELFRDWAAGRKTIGGKPQTLFQKIIKFIKSLGGVLNKEGFDDPSKIFEAIQSGEIGRRERRTPADRTQMFSRRGPAEFNSFSREGQEELDRVLAKTRRIPAGEFDIPVPQQAIDQGYSEQKFIHVGPEGISDYDFDADRVNAGLSPEGIYASRDADKIRMYADRLREAGVTPFEYELTTTARNIFVLNRDKPNKAMVDAYRRQLEKRFGGNTNYIEGKLSDFKERAVPPTDMTRKERSDIYRAGGAEVLLDGEDFVFLNKEQVRDVAADFNPSDQGRSGLFFSRRAMANPYNVNMQDTIVPIYPGTENALNRKQGSVKKEVFAREMFERTGLDGLIEYNEETMEQTARKMATEALMALQFDNNAIGWYDEKLRQAKNVVELVEPSIFASPENELAFDYALAVTSNGTAVIDNFPYALSAYRYWMQNNRFPVEDFTVGGERINDMKKSFRFYNEYQKLYSSGQIDTPLGEFLDNQYQVRDLKKVLRGLRDKYDIKISIPTGEGANAVVRGSLILGPKIGQGFYQNLRGNYNELTADMWWMRMWNRMVGNPFKPRPTAEVIKERRQKMRDQIRNPVGSLEATIIEDAIQRSGLNRSDIKSNRNLDELAVAIRSRWNSYFRKFKEEQGVNPEKPNFFRFVDTYVGGLNDQLEDAPRGPAERQFMRDTTARARELLQQEGVNINTADFQALLWYPEKRLWLSGGVAPGRGSDNDYADAAIEAARQEGISDERIQEALADTRPKGIAADRRAGPSDAGVDQGTVRTDTSAERFSRRPDSTTAGNAARRVANRAGTNGQVWNVTRRGGSVRQANVVASYRVDPEFAQEYSTGGISTPEVVELEQSPESAAVFAQAIANASTKSPYAPAVYIYPEADYTGMRLFMNPEGNAGFALKDNDIVSVFNDPDNGLSRVSYPMIRLAFELGGRKLDAFDTVLPEIYNQNSFRAVSRTPWNDEFAPEGWDKEVFQKWNNGEPDVVFMAYDPKAKEYQEGDGELFQDYDDAVAAQDAQAQRYSRRFSRPSEADFSLEEITNRLVEQAPETNPIMKVFDKFFLGRVEGETRYQAFTRNLINKFLPGYLLDNYVNNEITDPANSVGRAMELSQGTTGRLWALSELGAMQFNKEDGTLSVIDAPDNMGLREIFEPIGTQYQREYEAYGIARRELRLRDKGRQGFKNLSKTDAQRTVSEFEQKYPFFRDVHNNYQTFNRRMIQLAIDAGLITKEQGEVFMDMDYLPFYRYAESAMDPSEMSKAMASRAHQSLKDPNVFEKELEGGTIKLGDMYENIAKNAGLIFSAALKNHAMQITADALDTATAMGGPKSWGRKAKKGEAGEKITFYRDGEEVQYIISDPALWSAVSGLNAKQKESWVKGLEMIGGILRSGVTLTPGFQLANLWRGKIDAYVKTGIEPYRFDETVKAMRDVYTNNKDVERFKIVSGMGGYLYGADAESLAETMKRSYRLKEPGGPVMQQIGDRFKQVVTELEKTGEASELAERIVIMRKLMAEGMSEREAVFQGLNLINYGRRGAGGSPVMSGIVNFLVPTVTFLNARIQGLARLIEDPKTPGELKATAFREIAGRGMLITAASVGLGLLAMQDEERWDNETIVEKVANDIIYIGDTKIRIPKAFEVGAIFGTIPVMTLDAIRQRDGSDLANATGHILLSTFAFNPVPQGLLPVLEVTANYDSFRGSPIESIALQRFPTELRAYETTPEIYKFLSRNGGSLAGLSPLEIQQLVEGYLGTMATNFIASTDTLMSATGAIPEKPAGTFGNPFVTSTAQILGLNRFVREDGEGASRFVSDFYEMKRDIDQTYAAIKEASIAGQTDYVNDLLKERGAAIGFRTYFNRVARQMSEINKAIDSVRRDPNLDSVTKQERLKELRQTKTRLAGQMVKAAKSSGYFD